jgi:hypothetical protein
LLRLCDESVEVSGFHPSLSKLTNIPIGSVAVAYDDPSSLETWILEFHQVLYSKDLPNGVLCPNQIRDNRHIVNNVPRQFAANKRSPTTHTIVTPETLIPLELQGIWSGFEFRTPTMDEWRYSANKIEMTSASICWEPHSDHFANRKQEYEPNKRYTNRYDTRHVRGLSSQYCMTWDNYERLNKKCKREVRVTTTGKRRGATAAKELAEKWEVALQMAEQTVEATTQRGVRDFTNVTGMKRLRSLDRQFQYRHIDCTIYGDTVQGPCCSINGNLHATVFTTPFGWTMAHGIASTGDVDKSLDLLHKRVGAPRVMCTDSANCFIGDKSNF